MPDVRHLHCERADLAQHREELGAFQGYDADFAPDDRALASV
jgi:hypothetical protein